MESNIEREATAYHEAGHAVAGFALKRAFTKVSIVPDDTTVGHCAFLDLPPEIGNLTGLRRLYLQRNQLTELPPEIGRLINLWNLPLEDNNLTTLPPEIGNLASLTSLDLNRNSLTKLPPEIGNLTRLTELHLDENNLTELPTEMEALIAKGVVTLSGNPLKG